MDWLTLIELDSPIDLTNLVKYYDRVSNKYYIININKLCKKLPYFRGAPYKYDNMVTKDINISPLFITHKLHYMFAYLYLEVMSLIKDSPRTVNTEDTIYSYNLEHQPIIISCFAQNGFRFSTEKNYLEVIFSQNTAKISFNLEDINHSQFLSLSTSFFMYFETELIQLHKISVTKSLAHFFNKLPFDH